MIENSDAVFFGKKRLPTARLAKSRAVTLLALRKNKYKTADIMQKMDWSLSHMESCTGFFSV